ncbi:unnamed protein product [Wickerhamomyces anomalus]
MDLFVFLIVFAVVIFFIAFLPLLSGVASYKLQATTQLEAKSSSRDSKFSKLKHIPNVSKSDIPFKFAPKINNGDSKIRNRKAKNADIDLNPSHYDYDLDELIEEENREDAEEKQREFQQRLYKGDNLQEMA